MLSVLVCARLDLRSELVEIVRLGEVPFTDLLVRDGCALAQDDVRAVVVLLLAEPLREIERALLEELHRTTKRIAITPTITALAVATVRIVVCISEETTVGAGGGSIFGPGRVHEAATMRCQSAIVRS